MLWLLIILLALIVYLIFFVSQFINIIFRDYAPFISTDKKTIKRILREIQIKERAIVYELGCGRARFLRIVEKTRTAAELIGVENLFSLYLFSKIKFKLQGSKIKLLKQDFFTVNLKNADLIYCYLNNTTMESLGEKFSLECRAGTQIISRSFPIPQFKPSKVIEIKNKKVYFYKITI